MMQYFKALFMGDKLKLVLTITASSYSVPFPYRTVNQSTNIHGRTNITFFKSRV